MTPLIIHNKLGFILKEERDHFNNNSIYDELDNKHIKYSGDNLRCCKNER